MPFLFLILLASILVGITARDATEIGSVSDGVNDASSVWSLGEALEHIEHPAAAPNLVVLTTGDYGYRSLALNWGCNLKHFGVWNHLVMALDAQLVELLSTQGINTFFAPALSVRRQKGILSYPILYISRLIVMN